MSKLYRVEWSKRYYGYGEVEIEADSEEEAHAKAMDSIGDNTSSLIYDEEGDEVNVIEEIETK